MMGQAIAAYLHFLFIFSAISLLVAEMCLYRQQLTLREAQRLILIDGMYGVSAILIASTGFARAVYFAKGWDFYRHNPIFWLKIGAFVVWALMSIPPTFHFLGWRAGLKQGKPPQISDPLYRIMRRFMRLQLMLAGIVPLFAVMMARAIGMN